MSQIRYADLSDALNRLSMVGQVAQQLKELEPTRKEVNGWAIELPALVAQYRLFADRNVPSLAPAPPGTKVRNAVAAGREKVAESPREITRGRTFTNLKAAVTKVIEAYTSAISEAWVGWVQSQTPRIENAELIPFENDTAYRAVVEQIRKLLEVIKRAKATPAESRIDFESVENIAATLRESLGKLPTDAPADVKAFLAATNTKDGAPLSLFTPAVDKWLKANNLFEKYRIRR